MDFPRIKRLPPYVFNITAELKMAARRRGEDIIDMSMGNPDGPTPPHIVAKLVEVAQRQDTHGYSMSKGIPRLRRAICGWYRSRFDVDLDPETEAIATSGSKEGIAHLALATLDRGDVVLVPNPSYPIHIYGPVIAGADIRHVRMTPGVDFFDELTRAIREMYPRPKMLIINFPSNPTTQCVELDFFEKVVAVAREYGILVVHDLAYADIVFDGWKAPSIMQVPGAKDVAVEGPQDCVREIAGVYQKRRDVLAKGLIDAGWNVDVPKASMYIWARIPDGYGGKDSLGFAKKLLTEAKVAVSPGIGFGEYGDDHVRFALIENEARIRQAVRGVKDMFKKDGLR